MGTGQVDELFDILRRQFFAEAILEGGADAAAGLLTIQLEQQERFLGRKIEIIASLRILDDVLPIVADRLDE